MHEAVSNTSHGFANTSHGDGRPDVMKCYELVTNV